MSRIVSRLATRLVFAVLACVSASLLVVFVLGRMIGFAFKPALVAGLAGAVSASQIALPRRDRRRAAAR